MLRVPSRTRPRRLASCPSTTTSSSPTPTATDSSTTAPARALGDAWELGWGGVLHDGFLRAVWRAGDDGLVVRHVALPKRAQAAVAAEGRRLLRFLESESRDVRFEQVSP